MGRFLADLKFAVRSLRRQPGFSIVAILTLALGIGAVSALFSIIHGVLLTPLPWPEPDRIVEIMDGNSRSPWLPVTAGAWLHLQENSATLEEVAPLDYVSFTVRGPEETASVTAGLTTAEMFDILDTRAVHGRLFSPEDDLPEAAGAAVISHGLWQRQYGSDPGVLGRTIEIDVNARFGPPRSVAEAYTIVGVLPPEFLPPLPGIEIWVPMRFDRTEANLGVSYLWLFGRMREGIALEAVRAELNGLLQAGDSGWVASGDTEDVAVSLRTLPEVLRGNIRPALLLLFAAVTLILLIGCANVANLLLSRAWNRSREMAVRAALGADRGKLVTSQLAESLVLAGAGTVLGLLLAQGLLAGILTLDPGMIPQQYGSIGINLPVLGFALASGLFSIVFFGLVPALRAARIDLQSTIREGGRGSTSGRSSRLLRSGVLVVEIALAVVLVIGSGLLLRSLARVSSVELGFSTRNVQTMALNLPRERYPDGEVRRQLADDLVSRVRELPGVETAGTVSIIPFTNLSTATYYRIPGAEDESEQPPLADIRRAGVGGLEALGVSLRSGRWLNDVDRTVTEGANILINEWMARTWWPDADPVGQLVDITSFGVTGTVVGVIGNMQLNNFTAAQRGLIIIPENGGFSIGLIARTAGDPDALVPALRSIMADLAPDLPATNIQTMADRVDGMVAGRRFQTVLMVLFGVLALLLAAIGVYGVAACAVSQRLGEFGIRMTLGAVRSDIMRLVLREGLILAGLGIVLGIGGALALSSLLNDLLFGVTPSDPVTLVAVPVILLAVTLLAGLLPARRATRVDPVVVLRRE